MAVDVIMPQMGESIFEGTITRWLKKPGDRVERDEPLFEISTDKVDAEIPAPSAGVLKEIKVTEGQTVPIQTVVAVIDAAGAGVAAAPAAPAPSAAPEKAAAPKAAPAPPAPSIPASSLPPRRLRLRPASMPRLLPCATMAKKFAVPPWSASSRKNTTWISPPWKEAGRADESARRIFSPRVGSGGARPAAPAAPARAGRGPVYSFCAAPGTGRRRGAPRARKCRAARADLFRQLRSPAHERDAPAHRRTHGGLQARLAARLLDRRSGHDQDRQDPRAFEGRVRSQVRRPS